jgi:hypothetical protein
MVSTSCAHGRRLARLCVCALVVAGGMQAGSGAARAATSSSGGEQETPVYTFLVRSGLSKRAKAQEAVFRGVVTTVRAGRTTVVSTVMTFRQPETLTALQAAIFRGTVIDEAPESTKTGTLAITYNEGTTVTVVIYEAYYEITASAGTIRFTSVALTEILHQLLT